MTDNLNPELTSLLRHFKLDRTYVQGQGSWLTDSLGHKVLDLSSQYGALPFGHNPPAIWRAIERIKQESTPTFVQPSRPIFAQKLAAKLAMRAPVGRHPGDSIVSFSQSGSEAIEIALRLCRLSTKRALIAGASRGYHGHTLGAAALSWQSAQQLDISVTPPGFTHIPWNDRDALETLFIDHGSELAALVLEPLQGEGGVFEGCPEYFHRAYELCHKHGAKLVLDEVQTGLGRLGEFLGADVYKLKADVIVLSKALGGGLVPLAACIVGKEVWSEDFALSHGSTFANNNLACAVGLAAIELLDDNNQAILKNARAVGLQIKERFQTLRDKYPGVISSLRGRGCLFAIEFEAISPESSFLAPYLFKTGGWNALVASYLLNVHGVRVIPSLAHPRALRIQPSLNISSKDLKRGLEALETL
ncbi:MAG: aspartate aminotransferase family protein, partial [Planctomycetota bacterium]|nr:aspartate aminotransferase family protein [Planctomycetota bacterium]